MSNQKAASRASAQLLAMANQVPVESQLEASPEHPYAYALIEGPPGRWTAARLEGVTARAVVPLEPNGQAEPLARAYSRANAEMFRRTVAKQWGRP